ncbi:MAG: saccharopine dehydrogenase NADP-binding domain-containing protein [Baekduia sp.]
MARDHDIVLLGATGFTGGLTAAELANRAPEDAKIALAGRNAAKLEQARERLAEKAPRLAEAELVTADVTSAPQMRDLAASTRVLATTVGPYILHGEEVVAACAAEGTDYADLTGEPEFVDRSYLRHHETAVSSGARLVHCCGFDSIPHDLGAQFTVEQLPSDGPIHVRGYVHSEGSIFSGGTLHSALLAMSRFRKALNNAKARAAVEKGQATSSRRARVETLTPHRALGYWALPMPTIDPAVIARTARAREEFGPDFSYGHYAAVKRLPFAIGGTAAVGGMVVGAQVPPVRRLLQKMAEPGTGPSEYKLDHATFWVRFIGEASGERVVTEVAGGEPGYRETSRMLAETALSLAYDELDETAGQVTTGQALGRSLRERLHRSGMTFTVLERS